MELMSDNVFVKPSAFENNYCLLVETDLVRLTEALSVVEI